MNTSCLIGRLTNDPELRHTQNNIAVTTFTLAIERDFAKDQTDFIDIVAWKQTAEFASKYFTKGLRVGVVGRIQSRNWEDKQGNKRKTVEVVADRVYFADGKKDGTQKNDAPSKDEPEFSEMQGGVDLPF